MLEILYGRWSEEGSRFVHDLEKVAHACGYTVDEVKAYGVIHCRTFRRTTGFCPYTKQAVGRNS